MNYASNQMNKLLKGWMLNYLFKLSLQFLRNRKRFYNFLKILLFGVFSYKVSKWPQLAPDNSATKTCVPEVIRP